MSKCNYETYRYIRELCEVENQSLVECRFPGVEMASILAVQARIVESECVCTDGEVKYSGKLLLGVVYEDADKRICRAERGAEFFHKVGCVDCTPACFAKGVFTAGHTTSRREGASVYFAAVVEARIQIFAETEAEYLVGGEEIVVKKEKKPFVQVYTLSGEVEETDEFEMDGVVDVLLHEEKVHIKDCKARLGEVEIDGEICYDVCALKEDGVVERYERILPLKMSLPCEESRDDDGVKCRIEVRSPSVSVVEEEDRAKISLVATIHAECTLYKKTYLEVATDAFSTATKLTLKSKNDVGRYLSSRKNEQIRVAGTPIAKVAEEGWSLCCLFLPEVELSKKGKQTEGVLEASALLKGLDGGYKISPLSLPITLDLALSDDEEAACVVTALCLKNFAQDGGVVEAILKVEICTFEQVEATFVMQAIEGAPLVKKDSAITVFIPKKGDGVWEIAKKMCISPKEVEKCNPEVHFPVSGDERIVVYRQR